MARLHLGLDPLRAQAGVLDDLDPRLFREGLEVGLSQRFLRGAADAEIDDLAILLGVRGSGRERDPCAHRDNGDLSPITPHGTLPLLII